MSSQVVRVEVELLSKENEDLFWGQFASVMDIRGISRMCMVDYGFKPLCAIGVCYNHDPKRHFYVDLEVNSEQKVQLECGIETETCRITVIPGGKNMLRDSAHSMFERYYSKGEKIVYSCPYYGGEYHPDMCRDEYSETLSYERLVSMK